MNNKHGIPDHDGHPGRYWDDLLTAYAMGDIAGEQKEYVRTHIESCGHCREELARIENFLNILPDPADKLDDNTRDEMLRAIKTRLPINGENQSSLSRWFWSLFGGKNFRFAYVTVVAIALIAMVNVATKTINPKSYKLRVIGGDELVAGAPAAIRVFVNNVDMADPSPIRDAPVTIGLQDSEGVRTKIYSGRTDQYGTLEAMFNIPGDAVGDYRLYIDTAHTNTGSPLAFNIVSTKPASILLSTDKPLYKPTQTVHIRSLMRDTTSGKALADRDVTIEISNPDGTKISRKELKSSEWGIVSTDLHLSDLADTGKYLIKAIAGEDTAELDFTVDKYVLPKFKIIIAPKSNYYLPGEMMKGTITAAYHFGKPVSNGDVTIDISRFDVADEHLKTIRATLDDEGEYEFEYRLPPFFAGTSFFEGGTELYLDVEVRDTGGQKFTSTKNVKVYPERLMLRVVPAGGRIVGGMLNTLYILAYRPDHSPVALSNVGIQYRSEFHDAVEVMPGIYRADIDANTDRLDEDIEFMGMRVSGVDPDEGRFDRNVNVPIVTEGMLLLTDATYYGPGDAINCLVSVPYYVRSVFIDLYGDNRTVLTKSIKVSDRQAEVNLSIPPDINGKFEVRAYAIEKHQGWGLREHGPDIWLRDARVVYIDTESAGGDISAKFDNDEYVPGGDGNLNIALTDGDGKPIQGALGLKMVDEALYTLAGEEGNLKQLYRVLVKDILEPEFQIKGAEFLRSLKPMVEPAVAFNPAGGRAVEAVIAAEMRPVEMDFAVDTSNASVVYSVAGFEKNNAWMGIMRFMIILLTILFAIYMIANFVLWSRPAYITLHHEDAGFTTLSRAGIAPFLFLGLAAPVYIISSLVMLAGLLKPDIRYSSNRPLLAKFGALSIFHLVAGIFGILIYIILGSQIKLSGLSWMPWYLIVIGLVLLFTIYANRLIRPAPVKASGIIWVVVIIILALVVLSAIAIPQFTNASRSAWESRAKGTSRTMELAEPGDWDEAADDFSQNEFGALGGAAPRGGEFFAMEEAEGLMMEKRAMTGAPPPAAHEKKDAATPPRLRRHFPETMLWIPELITDERGKVTLPVEFADSITDWRLDADAITSRGGYMTHQMGVRVFQPLFVDMDLPVELRRGDYIELPVVVYNFLDTEQRVRVELKANDSFQLSAGSYEQSLRLGPGEVGAVHYPITAKKVGKLELEVGAYGNNAADRVLRELDIIPEGIKQENSISGRLERGENQFSFNIPESAVDDSQVAVFKLHPGVVSQIVEGLENIFSKPYGCFEQTSSITYPNVLALKYMHDTKQIRPEVEATALTYIEMGYQRLLSFEVDGGGFDWFGNPPANILLSAYGMMLFKDMADVSYVDEAVLERTLQWLASKQEADGAFFSQGGINEGVLDYGSSRGKATAFTAWALRHANYGNTDIYARAMDSIKRNLSELDDNYVQALILNAIGDNESYSAMAETVADSLADSAIIDKDDLVHWDTETDTAVYSYGDSASVETTAIAVLGLMATDRHNELVDGAVNWLMSKKSPNGTWPTTSGTVMSLKAIIAAEDVKGRGAEGEVEIILNGQKFETITLTYKNNDLMHTVDLRPALEQGRNDITIATEIRGLTYQVSYWYNTPTVPIRDFWDRPGFEVKVDYDRTELESGGKVGVNVSVINRDNRPAMMVLVDLGLAPGFAPDVYSLDDLVDRGRIMRWERKANQITIYIEKVRSNSTFDFSFDITSSFPIRAKSGEVKAYRYYEPDDASVQPGVEFSVV